MKCARVAKRIQLDLAMETALGKLTDLNSFIRLRTDRRSLVSVNDANTKQRGVGLFAIASHFVVSLSIDLCVTDYAKKFVFIYIQNIQYFEKNLYKRK